MAELQLLGLTFITVFISELGDKSQLAAIALGSSCKSVRAVFLGTALALVVASFLGVWLGEGMGTLLPTRWVKGIAALGFLGMALKLLFWGEGDGDDGEADPSTDRLESPV